MKIKELKKYSPIVLRIGISLIFLWFGINQLINPESFLGYVPQWFSPHSIDRIHEHPLQLMHNIPKPSVHWLIMGNGFFETVFGFLLLIGLFTRFSSFLLSIHLLIISLSLGYNDIAIRDLGLLIATIVIFLNGYDKWCLNKNEKTNNNRRRICRSLFSKKIRR